ncbi:S-layer family protein [Paenibacillus cellulosilyticus]|uniref:S-layer family protein n=1 Tax=Paenibacillus cellulosilyticus TaxID=375489 RepID=A0A2V2YZX0_9BACL|nr:S-layer homology domain-containing protein [Paenibacillus cellulosilyticus]PWW08573.1 S-layer family protein [Paenibacillus cellulosilyticus]QKS48144.1 S-layer homology domain-containing protein [Paenibacillus cellulosilyticus]
MKKTMISAALAVVLMVPFAGQALASSPFTDISSSTAKQQIESLQAQGVISGVNASEFRPTESLTTAQGITLIVRSMNLSLAAIDFNTAPTASGWFKNVSDDAWYANDFINAKANGLDLAEDIDPKEPMTREQFVHLLVQGLEKTGNYPLIKMYINITDEAAITTEYQGTIQRALLYKLTELDKDGNFDPQAIVTRADAAVLVYNAVKFVETHQEPVVEQPSEEQPVDDGGSAVVELE